MLNEEFFNRFIANIAKFMGDNCEITVHDFRNGYEETIVEIINGHVTGRKKGGCPTSLFFEHYRDELFNDEPLYINTTKNGRILKSSSTFIRDDKGSVIGAVCINVDITNLVLAQNAIKAVSQYDSEPQGKEVFVQDVRELLEHYLLQCKYIIGKPPDLMSKEEKIKALTYLDSKGVLLITKSSARLCSFFGISKFTLYNYLDEIRTRQDEKE